MIDHSDLRHVISDGSRIRLDTKTSTSSTNNTTDRTLLVCYAPLMCTPSRASTSGKIRYGDRLIPSV